MIQIDGLRVRFGEREVLKGINLEFEREEDRV